MIPTRLIWQSNTSLFHGGFLILAVAVWLYVIYRRLKDRHPDHRLWFLFLPKALVAFLLLLLFFDPAWIITRQITPELRFLTVIDDSTSMEVVDRDGLSRHARAKRIAEQLERQRPDITFDRAAFNNRLVLSTENTSNQDEPGYRKTDLAQVLMDIENLSAIGRYDGVVLLTDGGDERFDPFRMPSIPHYIAAVGNNAGTYRDIAIHAVDVPVRAEAGTDIECMVALRGYGDADFLRRLARLRLELQERTENETSWVTIGQEIVDLREGMADVPMTIPGLDQVGERELRVRIDTVDGELTHLNNERRFAVTVEERHWHILLYARRLGRSISELRRMLAAEPGITLTSLIRLRDEHFVGQTADPMEPSERLESFPDSVTRLQPFRILILGAFPADEWSAIQMQAVIDFVADGGSVIFMGGKDAFGRGGYADTPLQVLFPWVIRNDEPQPVIAPLEAGLAPAVAQQGMISGWAERMHDAHPLQIHSMNRPGRLRAGAVALLNAIHEGEHVPVIAFQTYGRGRVMAVATDTMWRWRMAGREARAAYDHFWSNGIRFLAGQKEDGRFLRMDFDRDTYHPGERAEIRLQILGDHPEDRIRVQIDKQFGTELQTVALTRRPGASPAFSGHTLFTERGEHTFTFTVWVGNDLVETFTRQMWVGSRLNEGANIYVDHAFLNTLAARSGQSVTRENDLAPLPEQIDTHRMRTTQRKSEPLVQYRGIYLLLIVIVLAGEWIMRRRLNLL